MRLIWAFPPGDRTTGSYNAFHTHHRPVTILMVRPVLPLIGMHKLRGGGGRAAPAGGRRAASEAPAGTQHQTQTGRKASGSLPRGGAEKGETSTYRGGEAAPQGLELLRAKILRQATARGRGRLHAPAVGRCLGEGRGARVAAALAPVRSQSPAARPRDPSCPAGITPPDGSLPRAHRPPGARGRRGGGFALGSTPLRSPT